MKTRSFFTIFIILSFFISCSGIKMISAPDDKDLYTEQFLEKMNGIKKNYTSGNSDKALTDLRQIDEEKLLPLEIAFKNNLTGVIYFSKDNFEKSIEHFNKALLTSAKDEKLTAQLHLNISSSYFKLSLIDKSYDSIETSNYLKLDEESAKNYHHLKYVLATQLNKQDVALDSLVRLLGTSTSLFSLKGSPYFPKLMQLFEPLSKSEKVRLFDRFKEDKYISVAYLAYSEAEKNYYAGEREDAKKLIDWVISNYPDFKEIENLASQFSFKIENFKKLNPKAIGIVLPLTGKKAEFGQRALNGIDSSFRVFSKKEPYQEYVLHIRDSMGSSSVGAAAVKDLIEKEHVAAIIGGLFSSEGQREYLEAKRNGVLFISLSQLYIPKALKDHLLVEIPGSIESQVAMLMEESFIKQFGNRVLLFYPKNERGQSYVEEFWRTAQVNKVKIVGAQSYQQNITDYREPVKNVLDLRFPRQRQEELELLTQIHNLEKNQSIRRIQTLTPNIDFDWVFLPAFPHEALQIIPSFSYFDAYNLKFIGDPSWRTRTLSKQSSSLGQLYFIGDQLQEDQEKFSNYFQNIYKQSPKLIEIISHDSINIFEALISGSNYDSRSGLENAVKSKQKISGISGEWSLREDNVWIKHLIPHKIVNGKIEALDLSVQTN